MPPGEFLHRPKDLPITVRLPSRHWLCIRIVERPHIPSFEFDDSVDESLFDMMYR